MALTKQHYKAIAEIIKRQIKRYCTQGRYGCANGVESVSIKLADYFEQDNSRFNRQKFLDACEN